MAEGQKGNVMTRKLRNHDLLAEVKSFYIETDAWKEILALELPDMVARLEADLLSLAMAGQDLSQKSLVGMVVRAAFDFDSLDAYCLRFVKVLIKVHRDEVGTREPELENADKQKEQISFQARLLAKLGHLEHLPQTKLALLESLCGYVRAADLEEDRDSAMSTVVQYGDFKEFHEYVRQEGPKWRCVYVISLLRLAMPFTEDGSVHQKAKPRLAKAIIRAIENRKDDSGLAVIAHALHRLPLQLPPISRQ